MANTKVGTLGIKVWICNGEVYGKKDLSPNAGLSAAQTRPQNASPRGRGERSGGRGGRRGARKSVAAETKAE